MKIFVQQKRRIIWYVVFPIIVYDAKLFLLNVTGLIDALFALQNAELRRELAEVQNDLQSTNARCESALQLEAGAKAEIEAHERVAQEAREKYERELALHAQDVEVSVIIIGL